MKSKQFAIYDDSAIYSIGETIDQAIANADFCGCVEVLSFDPTGYTVNHDAKQIVDLTHTAKIHADSESANGLAKIRIISAALATSVNFHGGNIEFHVAKNGILVTEQELDAQ